MNRNSNPFGYGHGYGTMAYAVPEPEYHPEYHRPMPWNPYQPQPGVVWSPLSPEDREMLKRIEEKLDDLLKKTAPEAHQVEEIRRRVREAIGEKP